MSKNLTTSTPWIEGYIRLTGLDIRMIGLLRAIKESGSINQAAKLSGLSYKGAWQMIERANAGAPKALVSATTGGSRGGGTSLTEAGHALLYLFDRLEQQHSEFIEQLNRNLADDPDTLILLQRQVIKTSACNQLFGKITRISLGAVNAELTVTLNSGSQINTAISLSSIPDLGIKFGADAVILINSVDIILAVKDDATQFSSRNQLAGKVINIQTEETHCAVFILLPDGVVLTTVITQESARKLDLTLNMPIWAIFKTNASILGVLS